MTNLLEITGDDIALLNDADLRVLIGRLCEADFRLAKLPTKGILWGGHQDAGDGGLDVTVRSQFDPPKESFVPRKVTGFQVKKPDMPRSKILGEMRPKGILREEIKSLIHEGGAYSIVSSTGSTTESALKARRDAMRDAVANEPDHQQLHLDFLDRGRVATWVRSHPSLVLWVRDRIGQPLHSWRPYENWANAPDGVQEEYLIDDELRLYDGTSSDTGSSIIHGLQKLRLQLSNSSASIRLTGLSGVGKTRLVQALFDDRIGEQALNPTLAYYTDISNNPVPDPVAFANQLISANTKAILIVDNCSSELHNQLTKICTKSEVSLLTVEYDIRDDLPEETDVFRLESASDNLIEKLIEKRYPNISLIDAQTIAEFAGGNARLAIALANTLQQGESLSRLRDEELFKRLFHQRQQPNDNLLVSAEVCSLVYSFDGVDVATTSELAFLANLADKPLTTLNRDIQELKNRGLVQARGNWRAVLPHAIANRLAKRSLDSIPKNILVDRFLQSGAERLIQSFTRRLGYLHDCTIAVEIANDWLKPNGWLGATNCNFNSLGLTVFKNITPLAPEAALSMLERSTSIESGQAFTPEADWHRSEFVRLLRQLAYDTALFMRSVRILCRCALLEKPNTNDGSSARAILEDLFHIILSGTHAPPQIRASAIEELVHSDIREEVELGIVLLRATLQTHHFHTTNTSNFGARSRDFGYRPHSNQEVIDWYGTFVDIGLRVALSDRPIASRAKQVLANNLRGLWVIGEDVSQSFLEVIEKVIFQIHEKQAWNEGWLSIKEILRYDSKSMQEEVLVRLKQLEQLLRPANLLEQARTYALTNRWLRFGLEDDFSEDEKATSQWERVATLTREIGAEVAQDEAVFNLLLPELVVYSGNENRSEIFGKGLADGCEDRPKVWQKLYAALENTLPEKRYVSVFLGFLSSCATHDLDFYNKTLDNLIEDDLLASWFPHFQTNAPVDAKGIERLHRSLDSGKTPIDSFRQLAWGRRHESISDDDLAALIQKILAKEGGLLVAIEILKMRFHKSKDEPADYSHNLVAVACDVISKYPYDERQNRNHHPDYDLAQIAKVCLSEAEGIELAKKICQTLVECFQEHPSLAFDYSYLLRYLAQAHPYVFLDTFIGNDEIILYRIRFDDIDREDNPVNQIPERVLLNWCEADPETRYPQVVSSIQAYAKLKETEELQWKPLTFSILERAPNIQEILLRLQGTIQPTSWGGSYADTLERRLTLFTTLFEHENSIVRDWAQSQHLQLQDTIIKQREHELKANQTRFERFE